MLIFVPGISNTSGTNYNAAFPSLLILALYKREFDIELSLVNAVFITFVIALDDISEKSLTPSNSNTIGFKSNVNSFKSPYKTSFS